MDKIKIGYFADGPWSHEAFKLLNEDKSIEIKFIVPRTDTRDDTLKDYAKEYNIDYLQGVRINSEEFYAKAEEFDCDLFVSMSFNQIFRKDIINLPSLKTINCHAGKLPFYRGRNILNWVLINDEDEFGITVHYIDEGIDTGDIILQRTYPIDDGDDYNSLLEIAYKECAVILYDSVKLVQNDSVDRIKQETIHNIGFYCGQRREGDEILNWGQNSRDIFNFVRAISKPGPQARTYCKGKQILINKVKLIPGAPNYRSTTGQVVGKSTKGFIVKTSDSTVEVVDFEYVGRINIGDRLN